MTTKRKILVTGASRGIGQAICIKLLQQNYEVIGLARNFAANTYDEFSHFQQHTIDLADLETLPQTLADLSKQHPDISAVICNAGRGQFGSLEEFSYAQIQALINLNLVAPLYVTRAFLPAMKRHQQQSQYPYDLIFIGSEVALSGGRWGAVYTASKTALRGFSRALREECARNDIRVCLLNPGMVRSHFFAEMNFAPGDDDSNALYPEEIADAVFHVLSQRQGVVFDEINLAPAKKVIKKVPQK